jgi:hypothetical protein
MWLRLIGRRQGGTEESSGTPFGSGKGETEVDLVCANLLLVTLFWVGSDSARKYILENSQKSKTRYHSYHLSTSLCRNITVAISGKIY